MRAPCTIASLSMKGDLIEAVLANCLETGPCIEASLVSERESFNALMVEYSQALEDMFRIIFHSGDGPPKLHQCPLPDLLVKTVFWARKTVIAERDNYQQDEASFQATVRAALRTIGTLRY